MKIAITGASGFIGKAVIAHLTKQGHTFVALSRPQWDAYSTEPPTRLLDGVDAVIHLAGAPIAGSRWTEKTKQEIRNSRVFGTRSIVNAIEALPPQRRPKVMISGSAIGIYGNRGEETLSETSPTGTGFLADVVKEWEAEAKKVERLGVRLVLSRTSIVLGKGGGALAKMPPVVLGSGSQFMSWVHLDDMADFFSFALTNEKLSGAFNLASPNPVTNRDFVKALAKAKHIPITVKAPAFMLRLVLGEMSSMLFESQKVLPTEALRAGYEFAYTDLNSALKNIYQS